MSATENKTIHATQEALFEFAGYLLTCAEMALSPRGSPRYSALRFIEATRRLIDLPKHTRCFDEDPFLVEIRKKLDHLAIEQDQVQQLHEQLKDLLLEFAKEGARRAGCNPNRTKSIEGSG